MGRNTHAMRGSEQRIGQRTFRLAFGGEEIRIDNWIPKEIHRYRDPNFSIH
jgi:hypothetical protein